MPVFQLIAERYLDASYSPDAVARRCGVPADTIRRIAAELAHVAFEQAIELPIAWTDWAGRRHETMRGRPVAMHAMRGISAHSNGFHTCRAIHLLQVLLGTVDVPGGFRFKPPYPKPAPPANEARRQGRRQADDAAATACRSASSPGRRICWSIEAGKPIRIDKAYSWEAPLAAHGLMHTVIRNAWARRSLPDRHAVHVHGEHGLELVDEHGETIAMLTDKDENGNYKIPFIIYSDAYYSETVAYADLVLPDTTYLERHDCISLLDRPISHADGPGDAIRHPVVEPDRDVRPFQSVLLDLGARLGLPGWSTRTAARNIATMPTTSCATSARRAIGPLAGWRGEDGATIGKGEANPNQLERYIENGGFWHHELADDQRYYKMANRVLSRLRGARWDSWRTRSRSSSSSIASRCSASASPRAAMVAVLPPEAERERARAPISTRCRSGTRRSRRRLWSTGAIPAACAHAAADAHVPFVGIAECVAAADHQPEPAVRASRDRGRGSGSPTTTGSGSRAPTAGSRGRSGSSTASTPTRSGPGTRSASGAAPGG